MRRGDFQSRWSGPSTGPVDRCQGIGDLRGRHVRDQDRSGFRFRYDQGPLVRRQRAVGRHSSRRGLDAIQRQPMRIDDPDAAMPGIGDIQPVGAIHRQPVRAGHTGWHPGEARRLRDRRIAPHQERIRNVLTQFRVPSPTAFGY
jgi:hypothetical protein